jgi:predicted PurR-regulated permease PerM
MAAGLIAIVILHLLPALIAGLSAYALHRALIERLGRRWQPATTRYAALALLLLALAAGIAVAGAGLSELSASGESGGLPRLLQLFADTLDQLRANLPVWLAERIPASALALHEFAAHWLRVHAVEVQLWGRHTVRGITYAFIGLVIGLVISTSSGESGAPSSAFLQAWHGRLANLVRAFVDIVASQLRIALVNTVLTGLYLLVVLPLLGYRVPLASTLVAVTFFASLLPVAGNLISNSAIVLASLTVSPWLGAASLGFLMGVHKLEYFLNAHIVGVRIRVRSYELLTAMLVMEAALGLGGLIAAPIYYAWLVRELRDRGVV